MGAGEQVFEARARILKRVSKGARCLGKSGGALGEEGRQAGRQPTISKRRRNEVIIYLMYWMRMEHRKRGDYAPVQHGNSRGTGGTSGIITLVDRVEGTHKKQRKRCQRSAPAEPLNGAHKEQPRQPLTSTTET